MSIILFLASFNITGNFIRTVKEKKDEIALLKTMGMNKRDIFSFFMGMGILIAVVGVLIANIIAFTALYLQHTIGFVRIPLPGLPFTAIPVHLSLMRHVGFSLLTIGICILGALYPAIKGIKINIIEVLHDEHQR
jgi:lipoprotein-releasing system permease protein